jgi:hypothetical protein
MLNSKSVGCVTSKTLFSVCLWAINVTVTFISPVKAGIAGALKVILTPVWLVKQTDFMQNFTEKEVCLMV